MSIDPIALEQLSRDALIAMAGELGAKRPELLTRPELRDEIIRLSETDAEARKRARGWFGVARDLVASVVAQGLSLPDTADLIRGVNVRVPKSGPPVATVTLAEIYAAQGHLSKALKLLDEVLAKEPDHEAARMARARYAPSTNQDDPRMPPELEPELELDPEPEKETAGTQETCVDLGSDAPQRTSKPGDDGDASSDSSNEELPASPSPPCPEQNWALLMGREGFSPLFVWNVADGAYGRLSHEERSALCVRVLEVTSGWDGPVSFESFLPVRAPRGRTELIVGSGVLRVALGVRRGDGFLPLCVAAQFSLGSAPGITPVWLPPIRKSLEEWSSLVRPIADQLTTTLTVQ